MNFNRCFSPWNGILESDNVNTEHHFTMLPVNSKVDLNLRGLKKKRFWSCYIGCLDVNKSTGLDGISCKMLKMFAPAISRSLTSLFNFSLETGQVASEWKLARVTL